MSNNLERNLTAKSAEAQCNKLRLALSRIYKLDNFDLFFVPSLHVARVILSQLFLRQEQAYTQSRYFASFPPSELLRHARYPISQAGNVAIVPHIDPHTGQLTSLSERQVPGVLDASQSFASVLHRDLIRHCRLFICSLGVHAALSASLTLVALKTSEFSTLMRSELRLFEGAMVDPLAINACLQRIETGQWQPFNVAQIGKVELQKPLAVSSVSTPGLPFTCIPLAAQLGERLRITPAEGFWSSSHAMLHLAASVRSPSREAQPVTDEVSQRLQQLILTAM